jgi:hypothetical protein
MNGRTSPRTHSSLGHLEVDETVRVRTNGGQLIIGQVDDVRRTSNGEILSHAVTVNERGYNGDVWDVEAQYDPRDGWSDLVGVKRVYHGEETVFVEEPVKTVEPISPGIGPDRLDPGVTIEAVDGDHYRVVVPPWEREYDDKALVFNLDTKGNVCTKLDPEEVVERVE